MKYLPLRDCDTVSQALNFSTPDCHVIGGCDVYTTKAAGGDKKLYKSIEHSLESQYESLVRLSASLSPPYLPASEDRGGAGGDDHKGKRVDRRDRRGKSAGVVPDVDLSRASPFGPLSQITARRTFAYLIATLNASHPDYDFSHTLRPSDFRKERSMRAIMHNIDGMLQNLRPYDHLSPLATHLMPPTGAGAVAGNEAWSSRMWSLIDREMELRDCEKYSYAPDDDPFDDTQGGAVWSFYYFFFNKDRKRVCYLYVRGLSVISHSPVAAVLAAAPARTRPRRHYRPSVSVGDGAGKRASYWLGTKVSSADIETAGHDDDDGDDDDDEEMVDYEDDDDDQGGEFEPRGPDLDDVRGDLALGYYGYGYDGGDIEFDEYAAGAGATAGGVRDPSEEIGECMEI